MHYIALMLLSQAVFAGLIPVYPVTKFGAKRDGTTLDTIAIQRAIDRAALDGGGVVYFRPGKYLSGSLILRSNVTLDLEAGATILASPHPQDYSHDVFLYAKGASNITVQGRGTIDGNAHAILRHVPGGWRENGWRPKAMIEFIQCENVLLQDVTLKSSPKWTVHPIECERVNIRDISIIGGLGANHVANADGIDPDACTQVTISGCNIQSSDDAIVLKITRSSGRSKVCRDVNVTNCILATDASALKIGSESNGEFRNISFSNCTIRDAGNGVGLWMYDGGVVDGWTVNNINMTLSHGGQPIFMTAYRRTDATPWGTVRNVTISGISAVADGAIYVSGVPEKPFEGLTLENIRIVNRANRQINFEAEPPFPFEIWGFRKAPVDIFVRYVSGLRLHDSEMTWAEPENPNWGGAIRVSDVDDVQIDNFSGRQALGSKAPAITLRNVRGGFIRGCSAPEGTGTFLRLDRGTVGIAVMNNDLHRASRALDRVDPSVDKLFETSNRLPHQ